MQKLVNFFKEGIWLIPLDPKKPFRSFLIRLARILVGSMRGFTVDQCYLKASALTFYTMLSVIPILAVAFGIAKGFGFEESLQTEIWRRFHNQPEVADKIVEFSYSFLQHAQGGLIAGIGVIVLLWSVLKLLSNIEQALNDIWRVPNSRHFLRQFSDYLAIMLLCPIFIVASSSITIFIFTEVRHLAEQSHVVNIVQPFLFFGLRIVPYFLSWVLFTLIYMLMPNTKVSLKAGVLAGILAGTVYQIVQWIYIHFQIGLANYGAIYGSFAALPLFLLWIHLSWIIVLAGAEIAYHIECESANNSFGTRVQSSELVLGLLIAHHCVSDFIHGKGPTNISSIAQRHGISLNIVRSIAAQLVQERLISKVQSQPGGEEYQPAIEVSKITIKRVYDALNPSLKKSVSIHMTNEYNAIENALKRYENTLEKEASNIPIDKIGEST